MKHHPVSQPEPATLRLPADKRREQLIGVAIDLFSQKGFSGTTTREIAAAAGVTEAIIFRHFATKEQLYQAIIDQKVNSSKTVEWIAGVRTAMDRDDDQTVIRLLIHAIIDTHKTDPKFERLMLYAALEGNEIALLYMRRVTEAIIDSFCTYFERRQEKGRLRPVGAHAVLMAIVGMAQHYARSKYVHEIKGIGVNDDEMLESFTQIALHGLLIETRKR